MGGQRGREPGRHGDSRLVYGYTRGVRRGPRRAALAISAARLIDGTLGRAGLARPRLLVSGFWRSGTTWLQESLAEALGGKTVFEPLSPMEPRRRAAMTHRYPEDTEDLLQATVPGPQTPGGPFWADLDRACTGAHPTTYLLSCRRTVAESLRRTIVVKDVRLQANLAAFHLRYGTPIVHVRRHPCAVVASLVAADWHWSFARAPLASLLPRLSTALGDDERAAALRYDTDVLCRIAAFWAVTERIATAALGGQPWAMVLPYERFAAEPDVVMARICQTLALARRRSVDLSAPSASVDPEIFAAYGAPPRERWRTLLSPSEIDRIESVVDAIYPTWRSDVHDV